MTHASTFSGIGGPEVAAAMLGWENLFHCEINQFGRQVLDYYFHNAESYEDITTTDFTKWRGRVDVLTGGFPCQPFSYAGKRKGSQDDRYLWPYMLRCIEQVRPTWFVGENVAGITTMVLPGEDVKVGCQGTLFGQVDFMERRERYVIEEICQQLEGVGYSVQPIIIPACAVGAPHRRDRVFFIANRYDSSNSECHRRREILQHIQSELSNGDESVCDGGELNAANSENVQRNGCIVDECSRRQTLSESRNDCRADDSSDTSFKQGDGIKPKQSKTQQQEPCEFGGGNSEDGGERYATNSENDGSSRESSEEGSKMPRQDRWEMGKSEFNGRVWCIPRCEAGTSHLTAENRWRTFPSVSPVHRGNDGLPFPVDDLTIPFSKWRKESLKAYGNAIVPQVIYEIFRAIELVENNRECHFC